MLPRPRDPRTAVSRDDVEGADRVAIDVFLFDVGAVATGVTVVKVQHAAIV